MQFLDFDRIEGIFLHEFIKGSSVKTQIAIRCRQPTGGGGSYDGTQLSLVTCFGDVYPGIDSIRTVLCEILNQSVK